MTQGKLFTLSLVLFLIFLFSISLISFYEIKTLSSEILSLRSSISSMNSSLLLQQNKLNNYLNLTISSINNVSHDLAYEVNNINKTLNEKINVLKIETSFPVLIVDALNKTVYIPYQPHRIVSLDPSSTLDILALGYGKYLVGVDNDSIYYLPYPYNNTIFQLYKNKTVTDIGSTYTGADIEQILALRPDLVIGSEGWGYDNYISEILNQYGIPVLLLPSMNSISDIYKSVLMTGEAIGNGYKASILVYNMSSEIFNITNKVINVKPINVTIIGWINPTYATGGNNFINSLISLANGRNIFSNISGWPVISPEELLNANPSVIIIVSNYFNQTSLYQWLNSSIGNAYLNINAIKNNRVYVISGYYQSIIDEPSVYAPLALKLIAEILYPSNFNVTVPNNINPSNFNLG
ncbi:ABC-type Fe3+-hydroxamate transport system, periplasmic component [Caldisphaera lagunensis DSM 15908]|uniref:ABC-type Fe3+-hydroxamate transport system, periplasmic component n=1 Tax=Caldisphaera lagunensis (strain DSM 15908 / JCM 11604 / ANMR 0165 / IC-154) TaxID=1056495 RepID=L0A972_CALLD|nr:ABC transporter substrate-binding protein [Caldisphaera lagunensis]AFZ69974.1 ABC-type Fe3+-hydroxamate transport system, periplasmic component [Caldisphaera lagunensis DSM 15908]